MRSPLRSRVARCLTIASAAVVALAACSKEKKTSNGDVAPSAAPGVPAPVASSVAVADIDVGRAVANAKVTDKTETFKPTDTIYASVHTTGNAASATLVARWTFEDGQDVQEASQSIQPRGEAYTEFHISKPSGLPKGKYKVEIFLDTRSVGSKDFDVT
jgi:hypothetical protein